MPTRLTKFEQETIILFNEEDTFATCYTHNKSLMRKLRDLSAKSKAVTLQSEDERSQTYKFPKKWIRVQMPRVLTEEERQKLSERAKRTLWGDRKEE